MKKALFLLTCVLTISTAQAKTKELDDMPRILSFDQLSFNNIQEFIRMKDSDVIVELREGTTVPLQFLAKNRILSAMIDPNLVIKVDKTCYLRVVNKKCYMSEDLVQWEKAGRFMDGESVVRVVPSTNKPGLTIEASIVPYERGELEDDQPEEDSD